MKTIFRRIKFWYYITKAVFAGKPVRSWLRLENGKFMCDGDCGRWTLHGVCTCGLCHWLKYESNFSDKIERDQVSWHREYQTEDVMRYAEYQNECPHSLSWNDKCSKCTAEIEQFLKEWNDKP